MCSNHIGFVGLCISPLYKCDFTLRIRLLTEGIRQIPLRLTSFQFFSQLVAVVILQKKKNTNYIALDPPPQ